LCNHRLCDHRLYVHGLCTRKFNFLHPQQLEEKMNHWKVIVIAAGLTLSACALMSPGGSKAVATLKNSDGQTVGMVHFVDTAAGVQVSVDLKGLTVGLHGTHVHAGGVCDNSTDANGNVVKFGAALSHFDPAGTKFHGSPELAVQNFGHAGVLPNTQVTQAAETQAAGTQAAGSQSYLASNLTVRSGAFSVVGHAVIIHAGMDDQATQPTGNSGARIACGVVMPE
jgi:superoxide dismutase, Cu-Zn family